MKKLFYPLIVLLLVAFGCEKDTDFVNPNTSDADEMEDLQVSDDFNWKTTYSIKVKLPSTIPLDNSPIYIFDDDRLYYKGPANRNIYPITVPSYIDTLGVKVKTYNPFDPSTKDTKAPDSDGDGVKDNKDDFPNDQYKAYKNYFPSAGKGTLAYEDLWPSKGDYDFNDVVVDYRFETITNANDKVVEVKGTFVLRAVGAGNHNAFAFELPYISPDEVISVTGYEVDNPLFNLNSNGVEAGQSSVNVIVFDDAFDILQHPGGGTGINVDHGMSSVPVDSVVVNMVFMQNGVAATGGPITTWDLSIDYFDPYIIANVNNDGRGREIHLPGEYPTDLADTSYFNTYDDDTDEWAYGGGWKSGKMFWMKTYESHNNYPWALNIYESFDYMTEKNNILLGYLKFDDWAENGSNPNWYKVDNSSFKNNQYIY